MSIRDLAFGALADEERTAETARVARLAAEHQAAATRTRQFFAGLGITDVVVDGAVFILEEEDIHGKLRNGFAEVFWWTHPHEYAQGGTYDTVTFSSNLPSLARALKKIDAAREAGRFYQDPPKRTEGR